MAKNTIEIVIKADGSQVIKATTETGKSLKGLGKNAESAGKQTGGFGKSVLSLQSALGALGLGVAVNQLISFGVEAFKASAAAERLGAATDSLAQAIGVSGEAMVKAITTASNETISKTAAMKAANKAMLFGIVENEQEMAELTQIAVALGAAMGQDATKSIDDMTTALGRNSPLILDNLGLSIKLTDAYRIYADSIGVSVEALTEEQKAMAFRKAALIEGKKRVEELGGVTEDNAAKAEKLSAAWSDFKVAFGDLLGMMAGGIDSVTEFVRELEKGAQSWKWIIETAAALNEQTDSAAGTAVAMEAVNDATYGVASALNPLVGLMAAYSKLTADQTHVTLEATDQLYGYGEGLRRVGSVLEETHPVVKSWIEIHKDAGVELAESYRKIGEAAIEAARIEQETMQSLAISTAGYYNSLKEWQDDAATNEAEFNSQMANIRGGAIEAQKEAASSLSEELEKIEQERQDKLHWVMTGAHERTAEENEADLAYWNAHYDELKTTAETKTREKTDAILAEQSRAESAAAAAREKEKAEMTAHLEELKLKTVLAMMETTGQLEAMTGLVGISAADAAELISAGVLPVTQEMGLAIQATMGGMETSMAAASETATANQEILQAALGGTLTGAEDLGTSMTNMLTPVENVQTAIAGIGGGEEGGGAFGTLPTQIQDLGTEFSTNLPTNITTTDEAILLFSESAVTNLQPILDKITEVSDKLLEIYSINLPALQQMTIITSQVMVTAIATVNTALAEMNALIVQITANLVAMGEAAKTMIDEMRKISQVFAKYEELTRLVLKAAEAFDRLSTMAQKAHDSIRNAGDSSAAHTGIGFQRGTGPLGFLVPPGFPNDSFPINVESGERVLVAPKGRSIENIVGGRSQTNYFNLTVNTRASISTVLQDFRMMQALIG